MDTAFDPAAEARRVAGAPPEDVGRSDTALEGTPPSLDDDESLPDAVASREPPGGRERGRVLGFLAAVVAELKRVQWPDRKTLTTLTGVVLGFVLIAGGYLGALDAIFSRVIQSIL